MGKTIEENLRILFLWNLKVQFDISFFQEKSEEGLVSLYIFLTYSLKNKLIVWLIQLTLVS